MTAKLKVMDPRDKWRLRNNRVALLDIDTGEISPYLIQEGVLTPEDAERIGSKETSKVTSYFTMCEHKA